MSYRPIPYSLVSRLEGWLQSLRLHTGILTGVVLALGALATGVATWTQHQQITRYHKDRFAVQAEVAVERARDQIRAYIGLLSGVGALYDASESVGREEFRAYTLALGLEQNFPGVTAIGFAPRLAAHEWPSMAARARAEGLTGFAEESPAGEGVAIWFVEPFSGANLRLFGRNFHEDPVLREAMHLATRSGQAALSGPVRLNREWGEKQPPATVLFYPIYRKGQLRFTEVQRERAIEGFAFVILHSQRMFAGIGESLHVDMEVFDGGGVEMSRLLFDTDQHRMQGGVTATRFMEISKPEVYAQRTWTWYTGSTPVFEADVKYANAYVLLGGGVVTTLLVATLMGYLGSGRRRAEALAETMTERLRERNTALSQAIDELNYQKSVLDEHAIVSIADYRGRISYVNDRFCEISGYPREVLIGENHRIVKSGRHEEAFYHQLWATIASGRIWQGEICNRARDGREYWVQTTIVPFLDANGVPERYVSARTDITAMKLAREELQRHRDHLQELVDERTEEAVRAKEAAEAASLAKSEFLANMSHELRTPMHAILSYSELGKDKAARPDFSAEKAGNYFRRIHESGDRLLNLINDLLDLSKMEAGRMTYTLREADILKLAHKVGDGLNTLMQAKQVRLEYVPCPQGSAVFDPARIEQVFINLLSNAIRFSPEGGAIRVTCERVTLHGRRAEDAEQPGLRVSVEDEGPGIPADELESVFEKFVQASHSKSGAGGTGLGLTICREIVQAHRGRIWAENAAERGARFVFEFPANLPAGSL